MSTVYESKYEKCLLQLLGVMWIPDRFRFDFCCCFWESFKAWLLDFWFFLKVKDGDEEMLANFWKLNSYVAGSYDVRRDFELLNQELLKVEKNAAANRIFYLALPPSVFEPVTSNIRNTCMSQRYGIFCCVQCCIIYWQHGNIFLIRT